MNTTTSKNFQQQLLYLINKIEKIEDLCIEETPEQYGPYPDPEKIDFMKTLENIKKQKYTDGFRAGISHMASKILRILYS